MCRLRLFRLAKLGSSCLQRERIFQPLWEKLRAEREKMSSDILPRSRPLCLKTKFSTDVAGSLLDARKYDFKGRPTSPDEWSTIITMEKPTNPNRPKNHVRPASSRRPDQEQFSLRWVSNHELLWWCTLSKDIFIQMTTPWSAQARDTTLDTRVTHCNFGLIKVETEDQTYGPELPTCSGSNKLEESSPRNDDSDMVEPMAAPSSHMFKARGSGKCKSGIEAFHTPVLKLKPSPILSNSSSGVSSSLIYRSRDR